MKAMYINPFLKSACYIFEQFQLSCKIGSPTVLPTPFTGKEVLSVIGVTGKIRGQVYLGITMPSALKIVSTMMGGASVTEFDEMGQSAISELSNMICGNAITRFSEEGISLDITPPSLIIGKKMEVATVNLRVLSIPIHIDGLDSLELNIVFKD